MANYTENYQLEKPLPEEFYDVGVQNSNWDKIDTAIAAIDATKAEDKGDLADDDALPLVDSADSSKTKRVLWSTVKTALANLFVPLTRKVNGKALSEDLTLTGEDIKVSGSDETSISSSLSNKLPAPMEISPDTDLNNVTSPGLYFCGAGLTVSNAPPNPMSETAFSLLVERTHAAGIKQTLSWYYTGSSYYRTFDGESWHDWALNATATPPQKQNISLLNGVQPTDSGCVFWKQQDNVCTVAIACTKPTDGLTPDMIIGTLPVGFRPSYIERVGYADTSSAQTFSAVLRIYEDGNIQIWFPNTSANVFVAEASFPVRDNGGTE